jgi:hypothetical protein
VRFRLSGAEFLFDKLVVVKFLVRQSEAGWDALVRAVAKVHDEMHDAKP